MSGMPLTETDTQPALETQRSHAEKQARPELEKWRQVAERKAEETLDADAMAAIDETVKAIDAIAAGKTKEALQMIEQATGKVDVMIARNPKLARIPVRTEALILDAAPADMGEIRRLADLAETAMLLEDYPGARSLLDALRSEIRIRWIFRRRCGMRQLCLTGIARLQARHYWRRCAR